MKPQHYLDRWHQRVKTGITLPVILGLLTLSAGVFGFGVWAATAELASAAIARGNFIATGANKIVQHFEGGIIKELKVSEGDLVEPGAILVELDDTAARAQLRRLVLRRVTHRALGSRLDAERNGVDKLDFPAALQKEADDAEIARILESQRSEFAAGREELNGQIKVIRSRIEAIHQEIRGIESEKKSIEKQTGLLSEEIEANRALLEKGLVKRPRFLALQRAHAQLEGNTGSLEADIGRARERIAEAESQIVLAKSKHKEESMTSLRESRSEVSDVEERLKAARDILARLNVKSPVRGVVVKMHYNTTGGIIRAGGDILELLPADEKLLVEAKVDPSDIDQVHIGLTAQLRLVALNQRTTPLVDGKVIYVSADTVEGKAQDEIYYLARIEMDQAALAEIRELKIAPGMPVEVYIQTGQRTFFEYLLKPLMDSVARAFKEN